MKKKIALSLAFCLLACALCLPGMLFAPVRAEEPQQEPPPLKVYFNGELQDFTIGYYLSSFGLPYVETAALAGLETRFDAETGMVISEGENCSISFPLGPRSNTLATVRRGDTVEEVYIYAETPLGKTYVPHYFLEELLGFKCLFGTGTVDIVDPKRIAEHIRQGAPILEEFYAKASLDGEFSTQINEETLFSLTSDTFGVQAEGRCATSLDINRRGDVYSIDAKLDNSGLYTLLNLLYYIFPANESETFRDRVKISDPIAYQIYADGEFCYLKSDQLNALLAAEWFFGDDQFTDDVIRTLDGKWLRFTRDDFSGLDTLFSPLLISYTEPNLDDVLLSYANSILTRCADDDEKLAALDGSAYPLVMQYTDTLTFLLNAVTRREARGEDGEAYFFSFGAPTIRQAITRADILGPAKQKSFDGIFDELTLWVDYETTLSQGRMTGTQGKISFQMDNLPNPYGVPYGTLKADMTLRQETATEAKIIEKPTEYIEFERLFFETLRNRNPLPGTEDDGAETETEEEE